MPVDGDGRGSATHVPDLLAHDSGHTMRDTRSFDDGTAYVGATRGTAMIGSAATASARYTNSTALT